MKINCNYHHVSDSIVASSLPLSHFSATFFVSRDYTPNYTPKANYTPKQDSPTKKKPWGIILWGIIVPTFIVDWVYHFNKFGNPVRRYVGMEEVRIENPLFEEALHRGLSRIRRSGRTPMRWHKSKGATIRQKTKTRVVHVLPVLGKVFYAALFEKKVKKQDWSCWSKFSTLPSAAPLPEKTEEYIPQRTCPKELFFDWTGLRNLKKRKCDIFRGHLRRSGDANTNYVVNLGRPQAY